MPAHMLPPSGASSRALPVAPVRSAHARNRMIATMHRAKKAADTNSMLRTPTTVTNNAVSDGPASAPAVPPAAMNPYSRFACAVSNRSAIRLQNTLTANRLTTLTQTKNVAPTCTLCCPVVEKISQKQPKFATRNP